ncbi:MAG: 30S ribosomal protein S7 [Acidobacteriota bacterium]
MPRRAMVVRRETPPDRIYGSPLATKFVNCLMTKGKKSVAEWIFYGAMDVIRDKTKDDPIRVLKKAVDNVKPLLEVKSRRVGGATYQVPVEVNPVRRQSLAIRWILGYAVQRSSEKQMLTKLANELLDAANYRGGAIKKKEDTHRMAEANKAFAHYRW